MVGAPHSPREELKNSTNPIDQTLQWQKARLTASAVADMSVLAFIVLVFIVEAKFF